MLHIQDWQTWLCMDAVIPSPGLISTVLWSNCIWSGPSFLPELFLFSVLQCVLKRLRDLAIVLLFRKPSSVPGLIKNYFPHMWFLSYLIGTCFLSCLVGTCCTDWTLFSRLQPCWVQGCNVEDVREITLPVLFLGKQNNCPSSRTPRMPCRTWIFLDKGWRVTLLQGMESSSFAA